MEEDYLGQCFVMMGIYLCFIKEDYMEELAVVEKWLGECLFCVIGEIGIDLYWDKIYFCQQ